jgi:hypothetical protein
MDPTAPRHAAHVAMAVALAAVVSATAFHFLFFRYQYGIPLALFMVVLAAGVHGITAVTGKRGNLWAYLFMVPLLVSLAAETVYASDAVRIAGLVISVVSLTMFAYWFSAPRERFWDVKTLWPAALFAESFLPFFHLADYFNELIKGKSQLVRVLLGVAVAIPILVLIGALFVSSDALMRKVVSGIFTAENLDQVFVRTIWDAFALIFFLSAGWTMATRLLKSRRAKAHVHGLRVDAVMVTTVLVLLNLLFFVFLGFQFVYFFGGEQFIASQGITYAAYARGGFFSLLAVSVIVSAVLAAIYRFASMKHWSVRGFSVFLILQTGVVIVSAVRRLDLYVDAYGLSVLRFWAAEIIFVIALLLFFGMVAIIARFPYERIANATFVALITIFACTSLINVEDVVARHNVNRYLSGRTDLMDVRYLSSLSSDAIPALVELAKKRPDTRMNYPGFDSSAERTSIMSDLSNSNLPQDVRLEREARLMWLNDNERLLSEFLRDREQDLRKRQEEWRNLVFSDYVAIAAIGALSP